MRVLWVCCGDCGLFGGTVICLLLDPLNLFVVPQRSACVRVGERVIDTLLKKKGVAVQVESVNRWVCTKARLITGFRLRAKHLAGWLNNCDALLFWMSPGPEVHICRMVVPHI